MSLDLHANKLLAALDEDTRRLVAGDFEQVVLKVQQEIYPRGGPIEYVYFPVSAVTSAMIGTAALTSIGNEGMLGSPLVLGINRPLARTIVKFGGSALRIDARLFQDSLRRSSQLDRVVRGYLYVVVLQIMQSAACHRTHAIEQRCALWLLQTQDRIGANEFTLTQQFLADMMGVRRATVNPALGLLKKAGMINYVRGRMVIVNRARLKAAACECYRIMSTEYERLTTMVGST